MRKFKLSEDDFLQQFKDRLRFLQKSALAYDEGDYAEATRMAGSIVKLIGDRADKNGKARTSFVSLASRLGLKPKEMPDTAIKGLQVVLKEPGLYGPLCTLGLQASGATGLLPILDGISPTCDHPKLDFINWWNDVVLRDGYGNKFSRIQIIEVTRDKEDAHTDPELSEDFYNVAYKGGINLRHHETKPATFDPNPARVVIRQVAHEVLRAFNAELEPTATKIGDLSAHTPAFLLINRTNAAGIRSAVTGLLKISVHIDSTSDKKIWSEWSKFIVMNESSLNDELDEITRISLSLPGLVYRVKLLNIDPRAHTTVEAIFSNPSMGKYLLSVLNAR